MQSYIPVCEYHPQVKINKTELKNKTLKFSCQPFDHIFDHSKVAIDLSVSQTNSSKATICFPESKDAAVFLKLKRDTTFKLSSDEYGQYSASEEFKIKVLEK